MNEPATRARITLEGISSRAWEHPADRGALVALRKMQGFDTVLRKFASFMNERMVRMQLIGSSVRVTQSQFRRVHHLYQQAATTLDAPKTPELFIQASPLLNAVTVGIDEPKIVVNSALLDLFDDEELRFVLGHELGHALSGHALYRTLLAYLLMFGQALSGIPFGNIGVMALQAALSEWARKSELSCDRAGLLATQDVPTALRVQMKLASGGHLEDLDEAEFLAQAREFDESEDLRDSVIKLLMLDGQTHPMNVVRALELRRWVDSGDYSRILTGEYPRREGDKDATISAEAQAAAESYSTTFKESQDAGAKLLRDIGGGVTNFGKWVGDKFR